LGRKRIDRREQAAFDANAGGGRLFVSDDPLHLGQGGAAKALGVEGGVAGEKLVKQHAQGVNIGAGVDVDRALGLFGAHVFRRADELAVLGEESFFSEPAREAFGDAEVNDLGEEPAVGHDGDDVGGLEVAVNHALGVRVLHGVADLREEREAVFDAEPVGRGEGGDGVALDVLYHEIRLARFGHARVEHARDVEVVHEGEGLPLGLEASQDHARVHAGLDDFERDAARDEGSLLGHPDRAEPALADEFEEFIRADQRARRINGWRRRGRGRAVHQVVGAVVRFQKGFDLGAKRGVVAAGLIERGAALGGGQADDLFEDLLDAGIEIWRAV